MRSWKLEGSARCVKVFGIVAAPCGCVDAEQTTHVRYAFDPGLIECLGCGAVWGSEAGNNWELEDDRFRGEGAMKREKAATRGGEGA